MEKISNTITYYTFLYYVEKKNLGQPQILINILLCYRNMASIKMHFLHTYLCIGMGRVSFSVLGSGFGFLDIFSGHPRVKLGSKFFWQKLEIFLKQKFTLGYSGLVKFTPG